MKKSIQTLSIIVVCLIVMAGAASAAIEQSGYANSGPNYVGNYNYGGGCGMVDPSRYPGSTEYCSRWIPGHWVQVKVMIPGRWIYRPVWIPSRPASQYRWIPGFWQTTGYNVRPDVYVWGSHNGGYYGVPYTMYQTSGGGYFTPQGLWIPNNYGSQK